MTERLRLQVYDVTNTTLLGTVDHSYNRVALRRLNDVGRGEFTLAHKHDDEHDLLTRERVVRWQLYDGTDYQDRHATIIETDPQVLHVPEGEGMPSTRFAGPGLLGWLERAIIYPSPALSSRETLRRFGPMGEIDVTGVPEPTTDGKVSREDFPDRQAFVFVFDEQAVYHRVLTADPDRAGEAKMLLTSASWTDAKVFLDGSEVFHSPVGSTETWERGFPYDGEQHIVMIEGFGDPPSGSKNRIVWSWRTVEEITEVLDEGTDDEREVTREVATGLFRTFNSTTYDGDVAPTEPYWAAWEDYETYPGVTVGYIVKKLIGEAQDRGWQPGLTLGFDETYDSDGVEWPATVAHGFNTKATILWAVQQLKRWGCDADVTPDGELRLWVDRGDDLTTGGSPVELLSADGDTPPDFVRYQVTGPEIEGNVLLAETEGGFGESVDSGSVADYGRIEAGMEAGNSTSAMALEPAVKAVLAESAWPQREHNVELSQQGERLLDLADIGDRIVGQAIDGTATVRLVQVDYRQDDTGKVTTVLHAVPA